MWTWTTRSEVKHAVPIFNKKEPQERTKTLRNLEELRSLQMEKTVVRQPIPAP